MNENDVSTPKTNGNLFANSNVLDPKEQPISKPIPLKSRFFFLAFYRYDRVLFSFSKEIIDDHRNGNGDASISRLSTRYCSPHNYH